MYDFNPFFIHAFCQILVQDTRLDLKRMFAKDNETYKKTLHMKSTLFNFLRT